VSNRKQVAESRRCEACRVAELPKDRPAPHSPSLGSPVAGGRREPAPPGPHNWKASRTVRHFDDYRDAEAIAEAVQRPLWPTFRRKERPGPIPKRTSQQTGTPSSTSSAQAQCNDVMPCVSSTSMTPSKIRPTPHCRDEEAESARCAAIVLQADFRRYLTQALWLMSTRPSFELFSS